jgi:hypothetical protein
MEEKMKLILGAIALATGALASPIGGSAISRSAWCSTTAPQP